MAKNKTDRRPVLAGKQALIVGVANDNSIAYGCARVFRELPSMPVPPYSSAAMNN